MTSSALRPTDSFTMKGSNAMLLEEALARSRMREAEQAARAHRQARQLTAGRNWRRLARWSAHRAEKAVTNL